jgi:hypothetical protein
LVAPRVLASQREMLVRSASVATTESSIQWSYP